MKNKKLENSIIGLINLYTVVIGAALSVAVVGVINVDEGLKSITANSVMLFIAFIATLFPFFHGALRHLYDAYLENNASHIKKGALIVDFTLLFLHALAFLALSQLLKRPVDFWWFLGCVLTIDVVWGIFTTYGASSTKATNKTTTTKTPLPAEAKWTIINSLFIFTSLFYLVGNDVYPNASVNGTKISILVMIACVARSGFDYLWCRDIYFPK